MDRAVADFIQAKCVAVVGISSRPTKFGNTIYDELTRRGYRVLGVNASGREISGKVCYPNLAALPNGVDGVVVCVSPERAVPVLHEAASLGLKKVWLQQGAESPEVVALARELELNFVSSKCILMYAPPVRSFHAVHRFLAKLFGRL